MDGYGALGQSEMGRNASQIVFWYGIIYLLTSKESFIFCRVSKIGHAMIIYVDP